MDDGYLLFLSSEDQIIYSRGIGESVIYIKIDKHVNIAIRIYSMFLSVIVKLIKTVP